MNRRRRVHGSADDAQQVPMSGATSIWAGRRGLVVGLICLGVVLNYADRQIIAVLKPMLQDQLGWSDGDYGQVTSAFQLASAFAFLGAGWAVDRIGWRIANPLAVGLWSLAAAAHAVARTVGQFTLARAALGAAEAMGTPTAVKSVAALFPNSVRAMAYGFINAASNIGAVVTPLAIPFVALKIGWANAFLLTGGLGLVWVVAWFGLRASLARTAAPEPPTAAAAPVRAPLREVLSDRGTWAVAGARVLCDNIWWLLLYWMPDLFHRIFHLTMQEYGPPLAMIYAASAIGAVLAGIASNRLLAAGVSLGATRKGLLLAGAVMVTPVWFAPWASGYWIAAAILGLTLAGHQFFSVNIFALASDVAAPSRVATVVAIAAFSGNIAGMAMLQLAGWTLGHGYGYAPLLAWASGSYLLGVAWVQLLLPRVVAVREPRANPAAD
ncbi:MAG TPA: MFS transporter [Caulobacteraceae bacterium]|jgi:ACS family hexuronate transporter-like MFS transporter|nr:MFS transporter [Caulobacteraceae bacterium]